MTINLLPINYPPTANISGLQLSNDAATPNTVIDVAAGSCSDSTGVFLMTLPTASTISATVNGLNGLDTGSLAASKIYNVFVISDETGFQPTGLILSLAAAPALPSSSAPGGYNIYRRIGRVTTDGSSHFVVFYQTGNGVARSMVYDSPISVTVPSSGAPTTFAAVDLSAAVPAVVNSIAILNASYNPATASTNRANLRPTGSAVAFGSAPVIIGGSANGVAQLFPSFTMPVGVASAKAEIDAQVSNGSDVLGLKVAGYIDQL